MRECDNARLCVTPYALKRYKHLLKSTNGFAVREKI